MFWIKSAIATLNRQLNHSRLRLSSFKPVMYTAKPQLRTMRINTPPFKSIFNAELNRLISVFKKHDFELRIAGGAVRDILLGKAPNDIDFATTATPDEMKQMFDSENIRMINMKGEQHGTITCRINDKENFEVTTLRIDVATDGRHAEVEFTRDWQLDSLRRDLTVNSMFLDFDGILYDYFGGKDDLEICKVRFVGNPVARIQEDYLRILRYFRFFGRIAEDGSSHETETLKAIRDNASGLKGISGERIWMEMRKILTGNHAGHIVRVILELGIAPFIGLPQTCNIDEFVRIWELSHHHDPLPLTLLSALLHKEEEIYSLNERLKMSRDEQRLGSFLMKHRDDDMGRDHFAYCQDLLCDVVAKEPRSRERICELMKYCNDFDTLAQFSEWEAPKLPITGFHMLEAGFPKGPMLAKGLHEIRQRWKDSRYTKNAQELLGDIPEIKAKLDIK